MRQRMSKSVPPQRVEATVKTHHALCNVLTKGVVQSLIPLQGLRKLLSSAYFERSHNESDAKRKGKSGDWKAAGQSNASSPTPRSLGRVIIC